MQRKSHFCKGHFRHSHWIAQPSLLILHHSWPQENQDFNYQNGKEDDSPPFLPRLRNSFLGRKEIRANPKAMSLLKPSNLSYGFSIRSSSLNLRRLAMPPTKFLPGISFCRGKVTLRARGGEGEEGGERRTFLTLEEAGLVEMSGLSTHERFLCRLTISSLNLLRVIAEQEGCSIEELNAGTLCDWFVKDRLKREQNIDSAVLQWDDSELPF